MWVCWQDYCFGASSCTVSSGRLVQRALTRTHYTLVVEKACPPPSLMGGDTQMISVSYNNTTHQRVELDGLWFPPLACPLRLWYTHSSKEFNFFTLNLFEG